MICIFKFKFSKIRFGRFGALSVPHICLSHPLLGFVFGYSVFMPPKADMVNSAELLDNFVLLKSDSDDRMVSIDATPVWLLPVTHIPPIAKYRKR